MSYRKTYAELEELILKTALDTQMCRDIVRRSGLRSGLIDDGTNLTQQFGLPLPDHHRPQHPRRYVDNSLAWPYHDGTLTGVVTLWDERHNDVTSPVSDTTMDLLSDPQYRWNGMWFPGFTEQTRPPLGGRLTPPGINTAGEPWRGNALCWVGGQTLYDPFPFPDAPYYLWADMTDSISATPWSSGFVVGNGVTPIASATSDDAVGPMILKVWASLDYGSTWVQPWEQNSGNAGTGNFAQNINPHYTPSSGEDGGVGAQKGNVREEIRQDDVLFKFTLETTDADNWVEFAGLGIRTWGYNPF